MNSEFLIGKSVLSKSAVDLQASKGQRTSARILDVALEQFSRLGFERATMGDIARAAEVSSASLHYHFRDKDALWRAALLQLRSVIAEEERLLDVAEGQSALDQLEMALRLFLALSSNHRALGRIVALEGMAGGQRLQWLQDNLMGARNHRLTELARQAIADGDLKPFPPELVVISLQAAGAAMFNLAPLMDQAFDFNVNDARTREAHLSMVIEGFLGGLKTTKP